MTSGPATARGPVCARHHDRPTGLTCIRCGRPACPQCLRDASVGMQCIDCVSAGQRSVRTARTVAGAPAGLATQPLIVGILVVVNVAVFVLTAVDAGSVAHNSDGAVFLSGALVPYAVAGGQWWRLIVSGFLHIGPLHLVFNMVALYIIGRDVEAILGRARFAAVYGASLFGGSAAVMLFGDPATLVGGASGAVFGLMGALAVLLVRMRRSPGPAIGIIAVNVVLSVVLPGISILAHLGGLAVGALVTAVFVSGPGRSRPPVAVAAVAAVVVGLVLVVIVRDLALGPVVCDAAATCRVG